MKISLFFLITFSVFCTSINAFAIEDFKRHDYLFISSKFSRIVDFKIEDDKKIHYGLGVDIVRKIAVNLGVNIKIPTEIKIFQSMVR